MKRKKLGKLGLKRETIRRLSAETLANVAGGTSPCGGGCYPCDGGSPCDGGAYPCGPCVAGAGGGGGGSRFMCTGLKDPCCGTTLTAYC